MFVRCGQAVEAQNAPENAPVRVWRVCSLTVGWRLAHRASQEVIQALCCVLPIIVLIIPPISTRKVLGVYAQAVMTAVSHNIVPRQHLPMFHAVSQAVSLDLPSRNTYLGRLLGGRGENIHG